MILAEASAPVAVGAEDVWAVWTDVERWPEWDHEVEWCRIDGPFAVGTQGRLKPRGGPVAGFVLTEVLANRRFADRTRLPLATLSFFHEVNAEGEHLRITHRVEVAGPLGWLFARLMGPRMRVGLPLAVRGVAARAEARTRSAG